MGDLEKYYKTTHLFEMPAGPRFYTSWFIFVKISRMNIYEFD